MKPYMICRSWFRNSTRDLTEAFGDGDLDGKEHTLNVLSWSFALLYLGITDTVEPSDLAKDAFGDCRERC